MILRDPYLNLFCSTIVFKFLILSIIFGKKQRFCVKGIQNVLLSFI